MCVVFLLPQVPCLMSKLHRRRLTLFSALSISCKNFTLSGSAFLQVFGERLIIQFLQCNLVSHKMTRAKVASVEKIETCVNFSRALRWFPVLWRFDVKDLGVVPVCFAQQKSRVVTQVRFSSAAHWT